MVSMMAIHLSYAPLKKFKVVFIISIVLCTSFLHAQHFILIDSTDISSPVSASTDRLGLVYIADSKGNLRQYEKTTLKQIFSPQQQTQISLIEAWNPLKVFVFTSDFQEYFFLDRFLTASPRFSTSDLSSYIGLCTMSNDNNLWLVDYNEFGLKKFNINFSEFTVNTPFGLLLDPDNYNITFIREYQNLVFISDSNSGILIFDNLGNYLRKIERHGIDYFNFYNDELYFISHGKFHMINIYDGNYREVSLPRAEVLYAFVSDQVLTLITREQLLIYKIEKK